MIELNDSIINILLQERTLDDKLQIDVKNTIPRYMKSLDVQKDRTKAKDEVFTPVNIVKKMNDAFDVNYIVDYKEYIDRKVIEATCGEAPFLITRYDVSTGEKIPHIDRVGLLDRKLQRIPNDINKSEWIALSIRSLQATYGYEWQEDSIFLARKNLLLTVIEYYVDKFKELPKQDVIVEWATIISYNIFRMDGVTLCIPETNIKTKVMNWETKKMENFDGSKDVLREIEQQLF